MAPNLDEYDEQLTELKRAAAAAREIARDRRAINKGMKEVADNAGDPTLELTPAMKAALLNDQLAITQALQPILDAALAAITP